MSARWDNRLTLVVAGPGFGKTTLLAEAMTENRLAPRGDDHWLTCDQGDAHMVRLAEDIAGTLRAPRSPVGTGVVALAEGLAKIVLQQAPTHVCVMLDDVHEVTGDGDGAALLAELLIALPTNGHLVLASRAEPPLALARYESAGSLVRIDEDDLAMSADELAAFAALRQVPPEQLDGVGGWPALAELRALGHRGSVDDFLAEEVLSGLSDDERRVVATIATSGGADRHLIAAVTGCAIDPEELRGRVPLISYDESGWCAIHPLWSERLADYFDPVERNRILRESGRQLIERDLRAAVALLRDAGDHDGIDQALRLSCQANDLLTTSRMLGRLHADLPEEVRQRPIGKLVDAAITAAEDIDQGIARLELARRAFEEADDETGLLLAIEHLAVHYHWRENVDGLSRLWDQLGRLAHLPEGRRLHALGRVLIADTEGDPEGVLAALADDTVSEIPDRWQASIAWLRGTALLALGLPEAAHRHAAMAVAECSPSLRGPFSMLLVNTLFLCGEHSAAFAALDQMMAELEQTGHDYTCALGHCHAATHLAFVGRTDEARDHLRRARGHAGRTPNASASAALTSATIVLEVAAGDEEAAAILLKAQHTDRAVGDGRRRYGELRRLPLHYVLDPSTRDHWDRAALGPCFALALDLAKAMAAVRDQGDLRLAAALGPEHWAMAPSFLPPNWRAELVAASAGGGSERGRQEAERLTPAASLALRQLADRRGLPRPMRRWAVTLLHRLPVPPEVPVEVGVLGPTTLRRNGRAVEHPHWNRQRVRLLLMLLIARGGGAREEIAGWLWPDLDWSAAAGNLRVTLSYLIAVLEPERHEREPSYFVRSEATSIRLVRDEWLLVDAWEMERLLDLADDADRGGEPSVALGHLAAAVDTYRGPYMADAGYENWALPHRDRLLARYVAAAVRAGELTLASGDPTTALRLATRALQEEPYSEPAHCVAAAAHLAREDRAAARRALGTCRQKLSELGLAPTEQVHVLERALQAATTTS
ncbi:MAG TPA: BTAD domain-containing putative transcriptional regulator [Acidimicrobiales bacterium]|jgi:DNA-binding SARP family transcriptional activator